MAIEKDIKPMKLDMTAEDLEDILDRNTNGIDNDWEGAVKEINSFIDSRTTIIFESISEIDGGLMTHFILPSDASNSEKAILSALHIIFQSDEAQNFLMQTAENIMKRRHKKCVIH